MKRALSLMSSQRSKVVIIGAGAAGMAAASRFLQNGLNDFIVLEAENRIGGRIHSVEFDGGIIELGAQWCHGEIDNVVYEMSKDFNVLHPSRNTYEDLTFYSSDGTVIDKDLTDKICEVCADVRLTGSCETSLGDAFIKLFEHRISGLGLNKADLKTARLLLDYFHKLFLCLSCAKNWFEISYAETTLYKECEGNPRLYWRDGFRTIFDILTRKTSNHQERLPIDEKVSLNKEVNKIVWDSQNNNVVISCADGSSYNCDHAILTVSVGVLKNMIPCFVPELPAIKQNAIAAMDIGNIHKIFLKFSTKWWPDDLRGFSFVWADHDRRKIRQEFPHGPCENGHSWLEDFVGLYYFDSNSRILQGWVVGEMTQQVEQLPDDLVAEACMYLLNKFVGNMYKISQLEGILRSKWKNNPHFNGCWSFYSVAAAKQNITHSDLATPLFNSNKKAVVLFAGEITHSSYYSTVHGAVESGFREADRILNDFNPVKLIHRKVAIIGAGMAGLGAATALQGLNCTDFVLVEAQDKPGGRLCTVNIDGNLLELGAQWIHGKGNPLYDFARQHDLISDVMSKEGSGVYVRDNGELIDEDLVKTVDFEVGRILHECEAFVEAVDYPTSVGEYLESRFMEYLKKCQDDSDDVKQIKLELLNWHVRFQDCAMERREVKICCRKCHNIIFP